MAFPVLFYRLKPAAELGEAIDGSMHQDEGFGYANSGGKSATASDATPSPAVSCQRRPSPHDGVGHALICGISVTAAGAAPATCDCSGT